MTDPDKTAARSALRKLWPLAFGAACLWLLAGQMAGLDWAAVKTCFLDIPLWRWVLATGAAGASFWALAQYDLIAHRHFNTGIAPTAARRAGASAIALGQVTGFGPVVGAAVRWRLLPAVANCDILRLTAFLTLTFFASWAVIGLGTAVPVLLGLPWLAPVTLGLLVLAAGAALLLWPELRIGRVTLRLPSLPAAGAMLGLTFLDLLFAATALWLLFPQGAAPGLALFASAYALALGAGLLGGTPGGAGPFELALVAMLPQAGNAELVAALLGYRIIYYAVPAGIAAAYALFARPERAAQAQLPVATCFDGERPEHGIAAQGPALTLDSALAHATLLQTPQSLTLFLGARAGQTAALLPDLREAARRMNRLPALYKLSAKDAAALRRDGWRVALQCHEAIVNPQTYTLDLPARRQLRRALRKAEQAQITIDRPNAPDWIELDRINRAWTQQHGAERGLTMGRFCTGYLRDKPVFVARHKGRAIAFATLVTSPGQQSLDLIRHVSDLPSGTMQALIHAMILHAQRSGIRSFSLAGLPAPRLTRFAGGAHGLTRFKTAFAPVMVPRYFAAPDHVSMLVTAADLWRTISAPPPLTAPSTDAAWDISAQTAEAEPVRLAS